MSFPRYPKYKDSGVEWLGLVPEEWRVEPLKRQISSNDGGVWGNDPEGENDTIVLRSTEQTVDGRWNIDDPARRNLTESEVNASLLHEGDLLLTKSSGSSLHIGKTTLVTREVAEMRCCYSNFMQRLRLTDTYYPSLAWYALNNDIARRQFDLLSNSTTGLANLNAAMIGQIILPIPPIREQQAITSFLDRETAKIDALVAEQENLIALLKEKRQAVISHAVTKGLDPTMPMKDSGIEWLGEVPAHWEVVKLSRVSEDIGDGLHGTPEYVNDSLYYFINGNNLIDGLIAINEGTKNIDEAEYFKHFIALDSSSLLLSINGTIGNVGLYCGERVMLGKSAAYIKCSVDLYREYLRWIIESTFIKEYFERSVTGTTIKNLSLASIRGMPLPLPPRSDQIGINDFLNTQTAKIDDLTTEAQHTIDLLKERRSALISAAVTGKIDVRNLAS